MSTLVVSSVIQIGVGLLLNYVFAPKGPNITQEGPRLSDLNVSSSAYGQMINIAYGTFRMSGNVIWSPGLIEVANVTTQSGGGKGGGGGGSSTIKTWEYFGDFQIAFAEGPATEVIQIFADGKLIFDRTGTGSNFSMPGLNFRFYPGDEVQLPDSLIEADKGVGNVSAHRGMCNIVFERLPLVNFGNRIPNITAVISYNVSITLPFQTYVLLSGADFPGSVTGADTTSKIVIDFFNDQLYGLKQGGISRLGVNDLTMKVVVAGTGFSSESIEHCMNNFIYGQFGSNNVQSVDKKDPTTLQTLYSLSFNQIFYNELPREIVNGSFLGVKIIDFSEQGLAPVTVLVCSIDGATGSGGVQLIQDTGFGGVHILSDYSIDIGRGGNVIEDAVNQRTFFLQESDTISELYEVKGNLVFEPSLTGSVTPIVVPSIVKVATITKGGTDLPGTADITGSCVLPSEDAIILSNGVGMVKVDMDTGTILATNLTQGFFSQRNVSLTNRFAFPEPYPIDQGRFITIDTDDLTVVRSEDIGTLIPAFVENTVYQRGAYDYRNHSICVSRVNGLSVPSDPVVRVFLNRVSGLGVSVESILTDLSTRVGLKSADINFSSETGQTIDGYVLTQQGQARVSVEPLQKGFLFDIIESDFIVKSVSRGGASVLTINEDDVGRLGTSGREEFVKEIRAQDVELPLRVNIQFAEKEKDYQQNVQFEKRIGKVTPTTQSKTEETINLPMVLSATFAKQLAARWLYTIWEERLSFSSQIGWKFLRLDPTDIVTLNWRGETRTLRMSSVELGADLVLEFRATQEDAVTNVSTLIGDGGSGFIPQLVASSLPTKLLPMDIPLLSEADASFQNFVRAYFAVAGNDIVTYPGALLFRSADNGASYGEIATGPLESAWGVVDGTIPNPLQTATFDPITVIRLKVARGIADFTTKTDLQILNGENSLAIEGANGPEIIQFVNVTQIDVGTVDISRLLRGRRGTEDVSTGHALAERFVMLEFGKTYTFQLPLSFRNLPVPYKAVTLNTQLEDAQTLIITYTGQDLIPYSVAQLVAVRTTNTVTFSWLRRTRFGGQLLPLTGTVPTNETLEQYEIEFFDAFDGSTVLFLKVVNDVTTFALTKTDFEASCPLLNKLLSHQLPFSNWNFEDPILSSTITGWTGDIDDGTFGFIVATSSGGLSGPPSDPDGGTNLQFLVSNPTLGTFNPRTVTQTRHLVNDFFFDPSFLDSGPTLAYDLYLGSIDAADSIEFVVEVLNQAGIIIQTFGTGAQQFTAGTWQLFTGSVTMLATARQIRIKCIVDDLVGEPLDIPQGAFDQIRILLGASTGFSPLGIKIYQMSGIVGRGRSTLVRK